MGLKKQDMRTWIGFSWLRIGKSGGLMGLWVLQKVGEFLD